LSDIGGMLQETSRTFALSIPLLPEPLREEVSVAYLLFRIADTLEDETAMPAAERASALGLVASAAGEPETFSETIGAALDAMDIPTDHEGYARLMSNTGTVLAAFDRLGSGARATIASHLARTCRGMSEHIARGEVPGSVRELRDYCYTVAGIVGDLLTDLFVMSCPMSADQRERLSELAPLFGEALQLVNILRDENDDADSDRRYVPDGAERIELVGLAASDLYASAAYIGVLEAADADEGVIAFNGLNAMLAVETLSLVRRDGPGVKLDRGEVRCLFDRTAERAGSGGLCVGSMVRDALEAAGFGAVSPTPEAARRTR